MSTEENFKINHPCIRPGVFMFPLGEDRLQVKTLYRDFVLSGKVATQLLPRLAELSDGSRTLPEIVHCLQEEFANLTEDVILRSFSALQDYFLLDDGEGTGRSGNLDKFFASFALGGQGTAKKLTEAKLLLVSVGGIEKYFLTAAKDLGIQNIETTNLEARAIGDSLSCPENFPPADLLIFFSEYLLPQFEHKINRFCLQNNQPWLRVNLQACRGEIGPLVLPHRTPCWECYNLRRQANLVNYAENFNFENQAKNNPAQFSYITLPGIYRLVAELVALECAKQLSGFERPLSLGAQIRFDVVSFSSEVHPILKLPRCPACSPLQSVPPKSAFMPRVVAERIAV